MKNFINWFLFSSKDANKLSLTVKAAITGVITYVVLFANVFHMNFTADSFSPLVEAVGKVVEYGLMLGSSIGTIVGFFRKIDRTNNGTNAVINSLN